MMWEAPWLSPREYLLVWNLVQYNEQRVKYGDLQGSKTSYLTGQTP